MAWQNRIPVNDFNGKQHGYIQQQDDDRIWAFDMNGKKLGYYSIKDKKTYNVLGNLYGDGDLTIQMVLMNGARSLF